MAPASAFASFNSAVTSHPTRLTSVSSSCSARMRSASSLVRSAVPMSSPMAVSGVRIWCDTSASASASAFFSASRRSVAVRRAATIFASSFLSTARSPSR